MEKELVNKLTHLLELTQKKKEKTKEGLLEFDGRLEPIYKYLEEIEADTFEDDTRMQKREDIITYDKKFFHDNLPLTNVLTYGLHNIPCFVHPFELVNFNCTEGTSYIDYSKVLSGRYRGRIAIERISILEDTTELSYGYLGHELVHTQIEKNPNSLENFYNREVISIFIEMLISNSISEDVLNNIINYRYENVDLCLSGLKYDSMYHDQYFTFDELSQFKCYLSSALKALNLYNLYINSSSDKKLMILGMIEDIFRERISVEYFLDKMGINIDNSIDLDLVKQYVKKNKR